MVVLSDSYTAKRTGLTELDALQSSLNDSIDAIRTELHTNGLPELSNYSQKPHPLDDPNYTSSPRLYEARRLALGTQLHFASSRNSLTVLLSIDCWYSLVD
jgi:hypothetical protein